MSTTRESQLPLVASHTTGVVMDVMDVTHMPSIPVSMFKRLVGTANKNNRIFRCKSHPTNIVGQHYSLILPCQVSVNKIIIDKKKKLFTSEDVIPQVSVIYIKNQLYLCGDGHHTFVAAMEEGFHMQLLLKDFGLRHSGYKNWQSIKWASFVGGASAITGTPLLPFNSSYITQ
ncbi:hypothetical protein [Pseudomonas marginalis]|uniref:hypothetical protein n=1 Tax=Pseudomonas marginalis TaxID=298 RepID=UPI003B9DD6D6